MTDAPAEATIFLHYHSATGEIYGWDSHPCDARPDCSVIEMPLSAGIPDHKTQKVDIATRAIVAKSGDEIVPTIALVKTRIARELSATDGLMIADRPIADAMREVWKAYRQALRGLSKLSTPSDMIRAWPLRPDGADIVSDLRKTI